MAYSLCSKNEECYSCPRAGLGFGGNGGAGDSETNQDLEDSAQEVIKYALKTHHGMLLGQRKE